MNFRPNPFTSNWDDHQWAIISQTGTFDEANHPPRKGLYFDAKSFLELQWCLIEFTHVTNLLEYIFF